MCCAVVGGLLFRERGRALRPGVEPGCSPSDAALVGECQGSGCSAPLATLLPLADAIVEGELGAMDAEAVRLGENIPTGLECYHGSRVNTWCCGSYDCADRERPGAA